MNEHTEKRKSACSDKSKKIKNSNALDSLFADLDHDLEQQYEEEEHEFFLLETQCMVDDIVDAAVTEAVGELYSELTDRFRLNKLEESKNEISEENLLRPSEVLQKRKASKHSLNNNIQQINNTNTSEESLVDNKLIKQVAPLELSTSESESINISTNQCQNTSLLSENTVTANKFYETPKQLSNSHFTFPESNFSSDDIDDKASENVPILADQVDGVKTHDPQNQTLSIRVPNCSDEKNSDIEAIEETSTDTEIIRSRNESVRKSKRVVKIKPNYKDKVWRNISCIATEVEELDDAVDLHAKNSAEIDAKKKSFCSVQ